MSLSQGDKSPPGDEHPPGDKHLQGGEHPPGDDHPPEDKPSPGSEHPPGGEHPPGEEPLEYDFKFLKLGLEPSEFERCLKSKLDRLVEDQPKEIKDLGTKSISNVLKEVCVRQIDGEESPRMDKRYKIMEKYLKDGYLRNEEDTFWKNNQDSKGKQGTEQKRKTWRRNYHSLQEQLLKKTFLRSKFSEEDVDNIVEQKISVVPCCNVIDKVTANLIRSDLNAFKRKELKDVFELCGSIVRGRTAVDWAVENDFFNKGFLVWKNHVLIVTTFAALMAVVDMISRRLFAMQGRTSSNSAGPSNDDGDGNKSIT